MSFLEADFFNLSDLPESCREASGDVPSLTNSGDLDPAGSPHSKTTSFLEVGEDEDEPFLSIDPLLVDMDMQLLPDGRMW